ncbi:MAG: Hsp20/alpha crystallin family protein [Planctomycetota bacterium]|nr:MAG: Hsp20/alpha crystallin family protein [Planctomycetota bacterium]
MRYLIPWRRQAPSEVHSPMNRAFDALLGSFPGFPTELSALVNGDGPRIDVRESADAVHVEAELPGVDENDVELSLHEGMLVLKGEKKVESKQDHTGWHQIERAYGSFQRVIGLPTEVDAAKVEATFEKGVLRVRLPKSAPARPSVQKIAIKSGR